MSWHLFEKVLDEVGKQATIVGKVWITLLFMFRIITLTRNAETLYGDEQGSFRCNTKEPGCENMCFNAFSPISHVRFWAFQTLITATPSIVFVVFAAHTVSRLQKSNAKKKKRQRKQSFASEVEIRDQSQHHHRLSRSAGDLSRGHEYLYPVLQPQCMGTFNSIIACPIYKAGSDEKSCNACKYFSEIQLFDCKEERTRANRISTPRTQLSNLSRKYNVNGNSLSEAERILSAAYKAQCFLRILLEISFLTIQCFFFGYEVPESYVCAVFPCPHAVDCFISRPGEKSSMLIYMCFVTTVCISLSVYELLLLVKKSVCDSIKGICVRNPFSRRKKASLTSSGQPHGRYGKEWFFIEGFLENSERTSTSSKSESDTTDASIDTGELDEMYEQEAELEAGECEDLNEQDEF